MRKQKLNQLWCRRRAWQVVLIPAGLLALAGTAHSQEALRLSMAGDLAATLQQQANTSLGYYNLLLGPTTWRFASGLGLEYNSNVQLESNGSGDPSDIIIRPHLDTMMHWPVTLKNSLDITLEAGYSEYLQHSDLSQFFINPGSGLSFDVYVGDFKINLHERIAITENTYENAGVSGGNRNLESLQNTAGTTVLWDLNKAVINAGYDHANYVSLSSGSQDQQPDTSSENLFVNSGIRVRPELMLGLEAGGTVVTYSQTTGANTAPSPNAVQWSTGAFFSAKISEYMDLRLDAGYTDYTLDTTSTNLATSDTSGFYCSFSLTHRVNQFLRYTLTAGRSTDLSAYGQAQSYYFVRLTPAWSLFQNYTLTTPVWWQQGTRLYNNTFGSAADYQQIGLGFTVGRQVTRKLSANVGYNFVDETSNQAGLAYTVHTVDLNFNYQF